MNSEWILSILTGIAVVLTTSSVSFTIRRIIKIYSTYKMQKNELEKYKMELYKQRLELEGMKKKIELEEKGLEEKGLEEKTKYKDTKILIDNLINQYKNIS